MPTFTFSFLGEGSPIIDYRPKKSRVRLFYPLYPEAPIRLIQGLQNNLVTPPTNQFPGCLMEGLRGLPQAEADRGLWKAGGSSGGFSGPNRVDFSWKPLGDGCEEFSGACFAGTGSTRKAGSEVPGVSF